MTDRAAQAEASTITPAPAAAVRQTRRQRRPTGGPAVRKAAVEPSRAFPRPNGAPPYCLGRPARLWITAMTPRRRQAASAASIEASAGEPERAPSQYGAPFAGAGTATPCAAPASTPLPTMEPR